jgi:class 3 adenylate cyclase
MSTMYSIVEDLEKVGALAVLFNNDKINVDLKKNIKSPLYIALTFLIISIIIFLIVINIIIKNLKILEKWAVKVGDADFSTKIEIDTNDEIGRLSDVFNNMLEEIKIKLHLEKFVSKSTKSMIDKKSIKDSIITTGVTDRKNLAFIFSDVRGFTSFTEKNDPELVIEVLNMYFEMQAVIIKSRKGDIDDYVGDQIMAHFQGEKRIDTAIGVAVEIMREVKKLNDKRKKSGLPFFDIGIGVHSGEVVVGNIGASEFRMDFACLGDAVNLTSRLCGSAEPQEILVSKSAYQDSGKKHPVKKHEAITVKGKAEKIEVVSVLH